jgi:hypothetical protein
MRIHVFVVIYQLFTTQHPRPDTALRPQPNHDRTPFRPRFSVASAQQGSDITDPNLASACHWVARFGKMGRNFSID